jgi:hypothetical protein
MTDNKLQLVTDAASSAALPSAGRCRPGAAFVLSCDSGHGPCLH